MISNNIKKISNSAQSQLGGLNMKKFLYNCFAKKQVKMK